MHFISHLILLPISLSAYFHDRKIQAQHIWTRVRWRLAFIFFRGCFFSLSQRCIETFRIYKSNACKQEGKMVYFGG